MTATEDSGGFSTSVELTIRVSDVNDNAPKFELPDYQAHNVDEDIKPGTSILKVGLHFISNCLSSHFYFYFG